MCSRRQRFAIFHTRHIRKKFLGAIGIAFLFLVLYSVFHRRRGTRTIFIVEEHHEALAYWFHAADNGLIPKRGNILIHIDGHSDESTPEFLSGMPLFHYPQGDQEVSYFLQKNDVFIQGAVIAGLLSRVVWVWPSWDETLMDEKEPYKSSLVELGWFWSKGEEEEHPKEPHFCQCETFEVPQKGITKMCSFLNYSAPATDQQEVSMSPQLCQIETTYISEHVNEKRFVNKIMHDREWIKENESVILDIDEDYFGCESAANMLTSDGLSWATIETIDTHLNGFLCPKFAAHERIGNRFIRQLLQPFLTKCKSESDKTLCSGTEYFTKLLTDAYATLVSEFRQHPSMFCGRNDLHVRDAWMALGGIFFKLPVQHLRTIYNFGFCLSTSPKTLFFEMGRAEFTICHGLNPPNATIVFLHTPKKSEIVAQNRLLLQMSQSILRRRSSSLVTLSRSVRDGFTPRALAGLIEKEILATLRRASKEEWEVNYDDDLLGGKGGWKSRL